MVALTTISLILIYALGWFSDAGAEVITLTDENFDSHFGNENRDWLVKFYAPWCKHCKTLKPIFQELGNLSSNAGIGELDCTVHSKTADKFGVKSYPTIMYKQSGVIGKYDGPRTLEGLTHFVERMNSPAYLTIQSLEELEDQSSFSQDVTFLLVHNNQETADAASDTTRDRVVQLFKTTAVKMKQHASFAVLANSAALPTGLAKYGALSILKVEPDQEPVVLRNLAEVTAADLEAFVEHNNHPLISKFDNHNFKRLSDLKKIIVAAVVDPSRDITKDILAALEQSVATLTPEERHGFIFGHLDGVRWRSFMKLHNTRVSAILVLDQQHDLHQTFSVADSSDLSADVHSIVRSVVHHTADLEWQHSLPPTLTQKMLYRFRDYYPYSLLVIFLPVLFLLLVLGSPFPKEKKMKRT